MIDVADLTRDIINIPGVTDLHTINGDTEVPNFPIYHHEGEDRSHGYLEMTSYPKSGDSNPEVELGVYNLNNNTITWASKNEELEYLAMVKWSPNGERLLFQQLSRDQDVLEMYKMDLDKGNIQMVYQEKQKTWIDWLNNIYFLDKVMVLLCKVIEMDGQIYTTITGKGSWLIKLPKMILGLTVYQK